MNRMIQAVTVIAKLLALIWLTKVVGFAAAFLIVGGSIFLVIGFQFYLSRIVYKTVVPQLLRLSASQITIASLQETMHCLRTFYFNQIVRVNTPWREPLLNSGDHKAIPVLLLHGFFCNRGLWGSFADHLIDEGHHCEGISLEPVFGSISSYPQSIDIAINALLTKTGAKQVALIGHSMGGLAARAYIREFGATKIAKVISLGTPHQGTWLARFGHGVNTRQMAMSSSWLEALAAHEQSAMTNSLFTTIFTWYDNIVFPQGGQTIPGSKSIEVTGMGHISMLFDRQVQHVVADELRTVKVE